MRITNSTMIGWTKTGKGEYEHADGSTVKKAGGLWMVNGNLHDPRHPHPRRAPACGGPVCGGGVVETEV